jgi:Protein of unknown function (DUF3025)
VLPAIDWQRPWLAPLRSRGEAVAAAVASGLTVADALNAAVGEPILLGAGALSFVPQAALPRGEAFEAFVARTASVPTRDHLHDFFSGLIWLHHPALKRRLNELQAAAIARDGVRPVRGPLRDALTRFDEHGALLDAPASIWQALHSRDWQRLFVVERSLWKQARLRIVGHALLEQLAIAPRKPLTAFVHGAGHETGVVSSAAESWSARALLPLPVLGVPGWWPENENAGFYADVSVFRPAKTLPGAGAVAPVY